MITFYDIASTVPGLAFNHNTWKTRYSLNYKQIPYKTEWIEYSDIESVCKKMGIPPSAKKADGSDYYTLPAIYDTSTNTGISDSLVIAAYLDKIYPDKPTLLPAGTEALHAAFVDVLMSKMGSFRLFLSAIMKNVSPSTVDFFISSRPAVLGQPFLRVNLVGAELEAEWKDLEAGFSAIDRWYLRNGGGPFIMGDKPTFADFAVGGLLCLGNALSDDIPGRWKDVLEWNDGRWKKLGEALEKYAHAI